VGWVTGPPLSPPERFVVDPATGVTPSGERVVAWEQVTANGTSEGIAYRIAPAGGDFGPQAVIPASSTGAFPVVATGSDDNVALVWMSNDTLHIARRTPGGAAFTEATPIAATGVVPQNIQVAIHGGNVYAALLTETIGGGAITTSVRAYELPKGAAAIQKLPGQGADGSVDSATWKPQTDPVAQAVSPGIAVGAGRLNVVWQRVRGVAGANTGSTTLEVASKSLDGADPFDAGQPIDTVAEPRGPSNIEQAVVASGAHVYVAWARDDAIAFRDVAAMSPVGAVPVPLTFNLKAGADLNGDLVLGWEHRETAEGVISANVVSVPPGGPPDQPQRVSSPSSSASLNDLVVAADGTRLAVVDREFDDTGETLTVHPQGAFAPPGGSFGGIEDIAGVQERTNELIFNIDRGAIGGGRVIAVSTADDESGVPNQRLFLSERDATPPAFDAVSVPASATPGERIALAAGATDALTPVQIDWDFGDGSGARGAPATHAYGAPGNFTVTVRAHDAAGNVAVSTRSVVVAAPPGRDGGGAVTPTTPADRTSPVVSNLTSSNPRFRVGSGSSDVVGAATKRSPAGTAFRLRVDERSTLVLSFTGKVAGRKKGSRCIAGRKTGRACSIAVEPGTLLRTGRGPGAISIPFSGRIGGARLEPGTYRLAVSAIDAAGNRSKTRTVTFKVVSR
jgi:hypothetical protein